jgi:hypothetical protein
MPDMKRKSSNAAACGRAGRRGNPGRALAAALALSFAAAWGAVAAPTITYQGQPIATSAEVAGSDLQLNGVGYRGWKIYKAYVAALYLPHKTTAPTDVLAQQGPKRVQLRLLVGGSASYFADAFTGGIKKRVTPAQFEEMKDRIDAFDKLVRGLGDVKKGDVVNLDFVPDTGLVMTLNGKSMGQPIPGADLYTAMLKIWVADDARDKGLRAAMLGGTQN